MADPKLCFIIGPIGEALSSERKLADFLLEIVIRPVVSECGYQVKRADDDARPGSISNAVINDVFDADVVVADLTGFNPNVFYELGIRHAAGRPAIHIIAEAVRLPFDNSDQRTIFVDTTDHASISSAKDRLKQALIRINEAGYVLSNPVTQARGAAELGASADSRDRFVVDVEERIKALETRLEAASYISAEHSWAQQERLRDSIDDSIARGLANQLLRQRLSTSLAAGASMETASETTFAFADELARGNPNMHISTLHLLAKQAVREEMAQRRATVTTINP